MLKSSKTLAGTFVLALSTFGFVAVANAAASGSQLVRPEPIKLAKAEIEEDTQANNLSSSSRVTVINFGSATDDDASEADDTSKKSGRAASRKRSTKTVKAALERRQKYTSMIRKAAKKYGVPISIARAVVQVESNFNPRARGSAGEIGLMQIKPATARGLGYRGASASLYDPETNLEWGMKYLAGAHKLANGDLCGTILRYNAGHYAKRMNPVSRRYCSKVQTILASAQ